MYSRILQSCERFPDRTAIRDRHGAVTYRHLLLLAAELADSLSRFALAGRSVGLLDDNGAGFMAGLMAVWRREAVPVLLPTHAKPAELRAVIGQSGVEHILASNRLGPVLEELGGTVHDGGRLCIVAFPPAPRSPRSRADDCVAQYTSGTSGPSKLAVRSHEAVANEIETLCAAMELSEHDRVLTLPPTFHSFGLMGGTLAPLAAGGTVIYADFLPETVFALCREHRPTVMFAVPFMYSLLANAHGAGARNLSDLRLAFCAGSPLEPEVAERVRERLGIRLRQNYGSTETGTNCLDLLLDGGVGTVGRPLPGRRLRVVNEHGEVPGPGETGELQVQTSALARGYLWPAGNHIRTEEGWFATGDLGTIDDCGRVYITGRRALVINVAGEKVQPDEVESVLRRLPGVREVVALGVPHGAAGEAVKVVIVPEGELTVRTVRDWCASQLSGHKVPKVIEFRPELPRSPSGKVLRKYLLEGVPSGD